MKRHPLAFSFLFLLVGSGMGYGVARFEGSPAPKPATMTRAGGYEYINPLLSCDISEDVPYAGFSSLKSQLERQVSDLVAKGAVKRVAVYFRDMNRGRWTGVAVSDRYAPASLMKVPLLIAYLRETERTPTLMERSYMLDVPNDENAAESIRSTTSLTRGASYTTPQLLDAMIRESDNNAAYVLGGAIATSTISDVYTTFGVPSVFDAREDGVSPQDYFRLFRILYNASYLTKTNSGNALELLSKSEFKNGIVTGVAPGTNVAHKFGERTLSVTDGTTGIETKVKFERHDCGIVYYAGSPYGICIMTEGANFDSLETAIADLSRITYMSVRDGLLK